jgi:WD40 repeat protein
MAFHPSSPVLVSGSRDFTIKFFDISKPSIKKAYRSIQVIHQWRQLPLSLRYFTRSARHCECETLYLQNKLLTIKLQTSTTTYCILYLYF